MTRRQGVWLAVGLAAVVGSVGGSVAIRHMRFFQVRQVELRGVRYLTPDAVLAALALRPDHSVFDDLDRLERRVSAVRGVVAVRIERHLPGTIRVYVSERIPLAFVPGPEGFVVLDAEARPLPFDPTESGLDLPILDRPDPELARTLAAVRAARPDLYSAVGRVGAVPDGIALHLDTGRIVFGGVPDARTVDAADAVRQHLTAGNRGFEELDIRFEGWVVVRRSGA